MAREKRIGTIAKYTPFIALVILYSVLLYRDITTIADQIERSIAIWTNSLCISAVVGMVIGLMVMAQFDVLITGETSNIVYDFMKENSSTVAVKYNGIITFMISTMVSMVFIIIYLYTKNRLFLGLSALILNILFFSQMISIIADYLRIRNSRPSTAFSKYSNHMILPVIICVIQFFVTKKKVVGTIYCNIYTPSKHIYLILSLILIVLYFLLTAYCYFSNLYCLIGFAYLKKDPDKMKEKIDCLQEKEEQRENSLRRLAKYVDRKAMRIGLIGKIGLGFYFLAFHIKTYILEVYYAVLYLGMYINLRITKRLSRLLEPKRIRINSIRFCWITLVLELLSLDLILFIYLDGDDPCLKLFELLSTVIIIPVLLSWLAELKTNKKTPQ